MMSVLREKDMEINELRIQLDDKDRMLAALRSAARHRDLASAVYVEGLTTRDSAARLGLPHGTVTVTLMRLRTRLRATLARQLAAEERA